jgi:hypothetical protein
MAEIIIEKPTMQKVIYKLEKDMQRGYQTPNQYKAVSCFYYYQSK